jgi:hypothetical protein
MSVNINPTGQSVKVSVWLPSIRKTIPQKTPISPIFPCLFIHLLTVVLGMEPRAFLVRASYC